jgi:hypothetical protein
MPIYTDYDLVRYSDGQLTIALSPPTPIGGWTVLYEETRRFCGTSGIQKWLASGFNGVSGITVVNSGEGVIRVQINSTDSSGRNPGSYAYTITRMDSGHRTTLAEGYHVMGP